VTAEPEQQLTPEQQEEIAQRLALEQQFANPVVLPVRYSVDPLPGPDGQPVVLIAMMTPAGSQRLVMSRDDALTFASKIRKACQTGPQLVKPPSGLVVPRA
jgi:hypothetical protein